MFTEFNKNKIFLYSDELPRHNAILDISLIRLKRMSSLDNMIIL